MVEALDALPLPPLQLPVQQPQADPGLLPRPRACPTSTAAIRIDRQARQAARRGGRPSCWSTRPARRPSRPSGASSWPTIRVARHVVRRAGAGAGRRRTSCSTRGSPSSPRSIEGCAACGSGSGSTVEANLRIARGLDYYTGTVFEIFMAGYERLKSVGGGGRYDALATDGTDDVPRRRRLLRRLPHAGPAARPTACCRAAARCRAPCWSRSSTRSRARPSDAVAARAARPRHPVRGRRRRRRSSASRSGTPSAGASRSSGSPDDGGHEVKDIRSGDQVAADPGDLDPTRPRTCDPHGHRRRHRTRSSP